MRRILPLCLVLLYAGLLDAQVKFSDEGVKKAIERGAEYLWSRQRPDGSWPPFTGETYPTGPGALACYALLESGVNPQDERMQEALQWLAGTYSNQTYCVSLRCNVWKAANRSTADKYIENLRQESAQIADSTGDGSFTYSCSGSPTTGGDNSNSQFGLLALWAARQNDLRIKKSVWQLCRDHWIRTQNPDGGWPYRKSAGSVSSDTMTCAGLASLYVCVDNLQARDFIDQRATADVGMLKRIQRGLNWLDKNYEATSSGYYMYAIERVGLASGYKYFNKIDWYKRGATSLLNLQGANGSWMGGYGPLVETAFKMLFLIRGQHSVAFNKLKYDGNWNNRPRAMAALTRWMGRTFETTLNWQVADLAMPVGDWHDAPILFISGDKSPDFSDADVEKLRTFVLQGGTIFSCTEFGGIGFRKGIRDTYKKMFPELKLKALPRDHRIYSKEVYYGIKGRLIFHMISNGVRPLVIHCDRDLPRSWQANIRTGRTRPDYHAAVNVLRYVAGTLTNLRHRATSHWPEASERSWADDTITMVPLRHGGNWAPEPMAYKRLAILMGNRAGVELKVADPIAIDALPKSEAKIAAMTGVGRLELTDRERAAIKEFVTRGGTLIIDAAGGDDEFADSARKIIRKTFTERRQRLRTLALASPLYNLGQYGIKDVKYRQHTYRKVKTKYPQLEAVLMGSRAAVIFSSLDLTAGLVGYPSLAVEGYAPDSAFALMRNILIYAARPAEAPGGKDASKEAAGAEIDP